MLPLGNSSQKVNNAGPSSWAFTICIVPYPFSQCGNILVALLRLLLRLVVLQLVKPFLLFVVFVSLEVNPIRLGL